MVGVQALYEDGRGLEGPTRRDDDIHCLRIGQGPECRVNGPPPYRMAGIIYQSETGGGQRCGELRERFWMEVIIRDHGYPILRAS